MAKAGGRDENDTAPVGEVAMEVEVRRYSVEAAEEAMEEEVPLTKLPGGEPWLMTTPDRVFNTRAPTAGVVSNLASDSTPIAEVNARKVEPVEAEEEVVEVEADREAEEVAALASTLRALPTNSEAPIPPPNPCAQVSGLEARACATTPATESSMAA